MAEAQGKAEMTKLDDTKKKAADEDTKKKADLDKRIKDLEEQRAKLAAELAVAQAASPDSKQAQLDKLEALHAQALAEKAGPDGCCPTEEERKAACITTATDTQILDALAGKKLERLGKLTEDELETEAKRRKLKV